MDDTAAGSLLWPPVRSTPLALEPSRGRTGVLPVSSGRAGGQALLVGLMVLAFLVLVIARTTAPSTAPSQAPLASPGASGVVLASASPATTPTPVAPTSASPASSASPIGTPTSSASASAAPAPTVTPVPSTARTYKVKSGDTLGSIAAQFGTTVKAIVAANGIEDPSLIRVGQVLIIP
ncbi:MAG: LysM peptidoglycan-binding domain-containing protein [Candidatus Limnocylindrales bacterium]